MENEIDRIGINIHLCALGRVEQFARNHGMQIKFFGDGNNFFVSRRFKIDPVDLLVVVARYHMRILYLGFI